MTSYIEKIISDNKRKNIDVVVAGKTIAGRAVLKGGKGLFESTELLSPQFYASTPTLLIAMIPSSQLAFNSHFINKPGVQRINQIGGIYFYSYFVPHFTKTHSCQ
jgi:hypothetical protein